MTEAITTGVFGTLIVAMLIYLVARVDHLGDDMHGRIDRLTNEVHAQGERLARIEGKLDEHLRVHGEPR